jgi:hypothetical protein
MWVLWGKSFEPLDKRQVRELSAGKRKRERLGRWSVLWIGKGHGYLER